MTTELSEPELRARFNAIAMSRGLPTVKRFKDKTTAVRRLAAYEAKYGMPSTTTVPTAPPVVAEEPTAPAKKPNGLDAEAVRSQFAFRRDTPRDKTVALLLANIGEQLAMDVITKAAGSKERLANAIQGIRWRCSNSPSNKRGKMPFYVKIAEETEDDETTIGLHPED